MAGGWRVSIFLAPFCMNKAPTKKRSADVLSEEHTFTASPVNSQNTCLLAGQPRETIIHVKRVKLPVGGAEKLCLPTAADRMASPDLTRERVNPRTLAAASASIDSSPLSPGLQDVMDTDAASCFLASARRFPLSCEVSRGARQDSGPTL
ncbi:hypothetical protein E2C01_066987 [Portunus trituberculatus]|uniref:Uncharacterized protein n=1 Tax=Portunus trituberculatus TaxID=210409 RepID=A0A5B7HSG0_PORTR|nr:hypothetical protein [Portunus trituberculatus]